jgi:hypothetical protein
MDMSKITQETLNSMKSAQDLNKAITLATGLQGYSLEAPAKQLVPFLSPLRNIIPRRTSTTGSSTHWKAITAVDAMGKATGIEGTRGNGVRYSEVDRLATFKVVSLTDSVTLEAEAGGRNFQDVKATSATNLLLRIMTEEEKLILGGNVTSLGSISAPVVTATGTGGSIAAGTYSVKVAALTLVAANRISLNLQTANVTLGVPATDSNNTVIVGALDGVTTTSTGTTSGVLSGSTNLIAATVTPVTGALAYAWFVGVSGSETLQIVTTNSAVSLTALVAGGSAFTTADGSGDPLAFDGIIPQIINGNGKVIDKGNTSLTKANGGIQELDDINSYLFNMFKVGPTRYLVSEQLHKDITSAIIAGAGAPTLFVNNAEKNDITGNYLVRQYVNKSYGGQIIKIESHPWLPSGSMIVMCDNVPYPNANVPSVLEMECGYDYRQIEYAFTNPKYEYEVRTWEALKHYFPAAQAFITNVKPGVN